MTKTHSIHDLNYGTPPFALLPEYERDVAKPFYDLRVNFTYSLHLYLSARGWDALLLIGLYTAALYNLPRVKNVRDCPRKSDSFRIVWSSIYAKSGRVKVEHKLFFFRRNE